LLNNDIYKPFSNSRVQEVQYLSEMNNRPNVMVRGPLRRGVQCSRIGCIGLRPALLLWVSKQKTSTLWVAKLKYRESGQVRERFGQPPAQKRYTQDSA